MSALTHERAVTFQTPTAQRSCPAAIRRRFAGHRRARTANDGRSAPGRRGGRPLDGPVRERDTTMAVWVWRMAVIAAVLVDRATSAVPGVVRFAVIAPLKATKNEETLGAIMPSVDLASQAIAQPNGPLPGWKIRIESRNGNCSSTDGPLAAFELHDKSG